MAVKAKKNARKKSSEPEWTPFSRGRPVDWTGNPNVDTKEVWVNSRYQVFVYRPSFPGVPGHMVHLSIKRNDRMPIHDWRELQRIKNELCGTRCEAAELYPAEFRHTDMANQYHLWCLRPDKGFPFGFNDGRLVSSDKETKDMMNALKKEKPELVKHARQRGFEDHHNTDGCPEIGPLWSESFVMVELRGDEEVDRGEGIESCEDLPGPGYGPDPDIDGIS